MRKMVSSFCHKINSVVWGWLLVVFFLSSCQQNRKDVASRFSDSSIVVILDQPGEVAQKTISWLKNVLTQKERNFLLIEKHEFEEFRAAGDMLTLPLLVIPDAARVDLDLLTPLQAHINSGARVLLIAEQPFEQIGVWKEGKWIDAVEAAERFEDFPFQLLPLPGTFTPYSSGRLLPPTVQEQQFAAGEFINVEGSVAVVLKGSMEGVGAMELIDEAGNQWRHEISPSHFTSGVATLWWDAFVLVQAENSPTKSFSAPKAAFVVLTEGSFRCDALLLLRWRNTTPTPLRPEIPGVSPSLQRVKLEAVQELQLWTGSRVTTRAVEARYVSAPTLQGRSNALKASWRLIPLVLAKEKMTQTAAPVGGVLLRADLHNQPQCLRQRVAWLSLNVDELEILRLESLWTEALDGALTTLEAKFHLICVGTNGPTLLANEIPKVRARYDFSQLEEETFPRLDVEIYPVDKTAPVYRSIAQRVVEPGVVEIEMPTSISPGEYEVNLKHGTALSTQIQTRLQVEPRTFTRVDRIESQMGFILRDGAVWMNNAVHYSPAYLTRLPDTAALPKNWLSPEIYDPVQVDEDLTTLAKHGVDSIRVDITELNSSSPLRDFLLRAHNKKIFVRLNLSSIFAGGFSSGQIQNFIKESRLDEHRIAWFWDVLDNPSFGEESTRQNLVRSWKLWVDTYYGNREKLIQMLDPTIVDWIREDKSPPDHYLTQHGPWNPAVQIYRAFLNDLAYATAGEIVRSAQALRKFGTFGLLTSSQGILDAHSLRSVPWWSGTAGMCFQTVGIGLDHILDPNFDTYPMLLLSALTQEHTKPDSVLFFDGLGGDSLNPSVWMTPTTRKALFRSFHNFRKKILRGAWFLGDAFEGYNHQGLWKTGHFSCLGSPKDTWILWKEQIPYTPILPQRKTTKSREDSNDAHPITLDLESDARGPIGVLLNYCQNNKNETLPSSVRLLVGPPTPDRLFDKVGGLPAGRLRYLSAHLTSIKYLDARGSHQAAFTRAGATISLAKGDVTLTLTLENNGLADWTQRSREEALVLKNMQTGEIVAKLDRTVRRAEAIDVNVRSSAEKLVNSVGTTFGLFWNDSLIYVTPEIRWIPTRDWR